MINSVCVFTREFLDAVIDKRTDPESYIEFDNNDLKDKQRSIIKFEKGLIIEIVKILKDANFTVSLREIFQWDDDFIELSILAFGKLPSFPKRDKVLLALELSSFIVSEDRKYLSSPGLFSIFLTIPTFDEALNVFDFSSSPFIERFINLDNSNGFCAPIGVEKELEFILQEKKDLMIYFASLICKLVRSKCNNKIIIRSGFGIRLIKLLGLLPLDIIYDRVMFFLSIVGNSEFNLKKEGFANPDSLPTFGSSDMNNLILNFELLLQILHSDPLTLSTILSGSNTSTCRDIIPIARHIDVVPIPMKQWFVDKCSIVGDHFVIVSMVKHFQKSKYNVIKDCKILDYIYLVLSETDKICNINNSEFIEYIIDICSHDNVSHFDILLCIKITSLFVSDRQSSYLNLEFLRVFRGIVNSELNIILNHTHSVNIDTRDKFLYVRLARWFLMKKFVRSTPNEMIVLNCKDSIFKFINSNRLIRQDLAQYYNLTIDVHDKGRDRDTRAAMRALLNLNEYGEFIKPLDTSITTRNDLVLDINQAADEEDEDPFSNLNKEMENTLDVYNGDISKEQINEYIKEFFEHARLTLSYEDNMKFFRATGCDYDMTPVSRITGDFKGFLSEKVNLDIRFFDPKLILAYLWRFTKLYRDERLNDSLVMALVNSIQSTTIIIDNVKVDKDYAVCNDGKLQNMVVAILQGRFILPSGKVVIIDKMKEVEEKKEIRKFNPAEIYHEIKSYIDMTNESHPNNANEFFKGLFQFTFDNNLKDHLFEIFEAVCIYSESKDGFTINHDLSIANCYEGMFDTTDYMLATSQIKEMTQAPIQNQEIFNFLEDFDDDFDIPILD